MKVKIKYYKEEKACPSCNWDTNEFFQLDGWDKKDWLCGRCFSEELAHSEAEYNVIPQSALEQGRY